MDIGIAAIQYLISEQSLIIEGDNNEINEKIKNTKFFDIGLKTLSHKYIIFSLIKLLL